MPVIKVMDARLADMIAAGEVVDRPASVVKELMENALDASATVIDVSCENAGMSSVRVIDNGTGMDNDDAKRAFLRHATSKIDREADLSHIHTLGFRGEALAAISSVSSVTMKTRLEGSEGFMVTIEGGRLVSEGAAALNRGTDIEVRDLFFNTPARFKHIRSEQSERMRIIDVFDKMALSRPDVRMTLSIDGKSVRQTPGNGDMDALIDAVHGSRASKGMKMVDTEINKVSIKAWCLSPVTDRARNSDITIVINGRFIRNLTLTQAVTEGYHGHLMVNRYPVVLVHLGIDPSLIDVNVHPQKTQVRLVNEQVLAYHLSSLIRDTLSDSAHVIPRPLEDKPGRAPSETVTVQTLGLEEAGSYDRSGETDDTRQKLPDLEYVGTYAGTYLLFQNREGLFLVDQHAAEERIRYEHYYDALANPVFATKPMLLPRETTLPQADLGMLMANRKTLSDLGFVFTDEGLLSALPTWLLEDEIDIALETMAHMLEDKGAIDLSTLRDSLAKDISCKGAIKANKPLSRAETDALIRKLRTCRNPYRCPHGRPTIVKLSLLDVEKMFKRVV